MSGRQRETIWHSRSGEHANSVQHVVLYATTWKPVWEHANMPAKLFGAIVAHMCVCVLCHLVSSGRSVE